MCYEGGEKHATYPVASTVSINIGLYIGTVLLYSMYEAISLKPIKISMLII